jgi:hypothetical protein
MVSTIDDAEFAPRSAAQAERAPAGPQFGGGLGVGLDDAPEPLPVLRPPPLPEPVPGDGPLAGRGHPGGPGFTVPGASPGLSVWQQAQAAWLAAGAEWFSPLTATPATPAPSRNVSRSASRPARWGDRSRTLLLVAVAVVLVAAAVSAGYERFAAGQMSPRDYPGAQVAGTQFGADQTVPGRGVFQALTRVASSGGTVVAVGSQAGGDLTRGQFFVSTDAGNTWQVAPVRAAGGGDPAPGHPAQLIAAGPAGGEQGGEQAGAAGWLAVGPHSIWTSPDARSWTLAATTGITPTDSGDQVRVLTRTARGWLAAGQNTAEATGVIWTSADGLHWRRATAAQSRLPSRSGTIVTITGAVAHGQNILLSGQASRWDAEAGPRVTMTWLSTDGGRTWRGTSVPVNHGAGSGLAGIAAAGAGFVAVRPGTAPSGPTRAARPAGLVYASANGRGWHYVTTLTSANGVRISAVRGGAGGFAVLGEGPGGTLYGYTSPDGASWKPAASFGPAPGTVTGTTVTSSGVQIAAGATGTPAAEQPYLAVAAPGHAPRAINVARITGATIAQVGVDAVAVSGQQHVAVGESGGTLAVWSNTGSGPFTPGTWATVTGAAPAMLGTQKLNSVVHGPAGWLATGDALAGTTPYPVVVSSPDGRTWSPHRVPGLTRAHLAAAQAAADGARYVIVGSATTGAGTFPVAWSSPDLRTWTRAAGPASGGTGGGEPGRMLAVASGTRGFVAVGTQGIDPAVWTSAGGRHWAPHRLKIPGTAASAQLSQVAVSGRNVAAFGDETWASGRHAAFAEISHDGGRTWVPVPVASPGGVATITAVTAMSGGFTAVGSYGPAGDRDVAVWTSARGDTWLTRTPHRAGLSGPGIQQLKGLTATGTALTGVGFTASPTAERPTLWQVPPRQARRRA